MSELVPGQRLDQYQLIDVIARSGMATVFRACDTESGRAVAIKAPHLQHESDIVFHQRFLREERIGQRLDHPAIVKMFHPKEKSRLYLVMEYVEGDLLHERLEPEEPLPTAIAVAYAVQIADALIYLHEHRVVHRDLKPENILITPDAKVKLIDFGVAMDAAARKLTWSGLSHPLGTPEYMAPEQAKGRRGDGRSDLYSLGVILYRMLTGHVPFSGENVYAILQAKIHSWPIPPSRFQADLSPEFEEIILHALERDPHERFRNGAEFREALVYPEKVTITDRATRPHSKAGLATRLWKILGFTRKRKE